MSMQPSGPSNPPLRMKPSSRNVALDPRTLTSSASNSDDHRIPTSRGNESMAYYTVHTQADHSELPRARRTIEKARPPSHSSPAHVRGSAELLRPEPQLRTLIFTPSRLYHRQLKQRHCFQRKNRKTAVSQRFFPKPWLKAYNLSWKVRMRK